MACQGQPVQPWFTPVRSSSSVPALTPEPAQVTALDDDEVRSRLVGLPSWGLADEQIVTDYRFDDFRQAVAFVVRVAFEAEGVDHHPDIDVRYNRVRIALSTHSAGGVTDKDLDLAAVIEGASGR